MAISLLELVLFWMLFDVPYLIYRIILYFAYRRNLASLERPFVSILIPAYNEEVMIERTLESCIKQTYPHFEIIVINDGSSDRTAGIVNEVISRHKTRRIKLINQKNCGKAAALNKGLDLCEGEFVITVDADSRLDRHAVDVIMSKFVNEKIGAVAGNIVAVSHHEILAEIQKMEYRINSQFLREAQSALGSVTVTPGAFSAYRRKAMKRFEAGTVTEDFDTSAKILEKDYETIIAPEALCFTQVPLSISDLIRQRVRWQQGGLEVFSKHMFHKKRPAVSMEFFLIFFFAFYGLFPKVISLVFIPLAALSGNAVDAIAGFLLFLVYFALVWMVQLAVIGERKLKTYLLVPVFVLYWYTFILYAILAGQILALKQNKRWEALERYPI